MRSEQSHFTRYRWTGSSLGWAGYLRYTSRRCFPSKIQYSWRKFPRFPNEIRVQNDISVRSSTRQDENLFSLDVSRCPFKPSETHQRRPTHSRDVARHSESSRILRTSTANLTSNHSIPRGPNRESPLRVELSEN